MLLRLLLLPAWKGTVRCCRGLKAAVQRCLCLLQHMPVLLVQVLLLQEGTADMASLLPHCCCVHGTASMLTTCYQPMVHVKHTKLAHWRVAEKQTTEQPGESSSSLVMR